MGNSPGNPPPCYEKTSAGLVDVYVMYGTTFRMDQRLYTPTPTNDPAKRVRSPSAMHYFVYSRRQLIIIANSK